MFLHTNDHGDTIDDTGRIVDEDGTEPSAPVGMDIEDCIDYASDVINVDKARVELAGLHARIEKLEAGAASSFANGWRAAIEASADKLENYPVDMLKIDGDELDDVIDRDIDIAAELRAMKLPVTAA